ncbi:MAG: tRNA uridine-5-carboxymethylaminomethyl(34) synthesis enzyme MnmG [Clostridia bacterium]|nr:tRNA uridine-5-carboxymethylaminomethyl(34) synthesis enzyme MnmG [Clostridia bacterium]
MTYSADIAVIGAGHAGIEAALAAARLGADTVVFTINPDAVANMPCNPSIGGTGKGHLVYELDALGGEMGYAADQVMLQSRTLNLGKGAAVQSKRIQADRNRYRVQMKHTLELQKNLRLVGAEVTDIGIETDSDGMPAVTSVKTVFGDIWKVNAAVICAGTYLYGRVFIGETSYSSGPDGMLAANSLSESLRRAGLSLRRFKTGTPPRILKSSVDLSRLEAQEGEKEIIPFSARTPADAFASFEQVPCHIAYTNQRTHDIIRSSLGRSPLYTGVIHGVGPRYCPSIEDKVVRFPSKERHQLFLEPLGSDTEEMYLGGFSSSLPGDVQYDMLRSIDGFEEAQIIRYAYAIEYDCVDPLELLPTLRVKSTRGLYGAGQFNGTSGYEEAAVQGLIAGINAARELEGKDAIILPRSSSYIGTLIDDLVTKGTEEPYRIMISRSEYRLLLRQDNADERLSTLGREAGLLSKEQYEGFLEKRSRIEEEKNRIRTVIVPPSSRLNEMLEKRGTAAVTIGAALADLIRRPQVDYSSLKEFDPGRPVLTPAEIKTVETDIKYEGYIRRQKAEVAQAERLENRVLPENIDYSTISGLRTEAAQKLQKLRPLNIGQASRISGVNPADISVLLIWLSQHQISRKREKSCGCVVFSLDGAGIPHIILIRNRKAGNISFPKGHVEAGETERQTAERELFEETGVSLDITEPFRVTISYRISSSATKEVVYFTAFTDMVRLRPQEEEISEIFWIPVEKAGGMILYDNERQVFEKALAFMRKKHPEKFR